MSNWKVGHFEHWLAHFDLLSRSAPNLDVFFENLLSTLLKLSARLIVVFILPQKWTSIFPAGAHQSINSCRAFHLRHKFFWSSGAERHLRDPSAPATLRRQVFILSRCTQRVCPAECARVYSTWSEHMAASNEMLTATFLFRLFACSRCRYPPLRVARSILIALPQEMGGASGNYIRAIFPSPNAISGYILLKSTRASNISNEIHLIGWKGLTQLSKHPEHCGWWLFFSGIYKSFLIASVWRPSSAGLCGWGHVRRRNSSGPFGCTSRPV